MFELHVGGWLTPRWALSGEIWATVDMEASTSFTPTGLTAGMLAVTRVLGSRTWIKGAAGFAQYSREDTLAAELTGDGGEVQLSGLGLGVAAGVELLQGRSFALDVIGRLGLGVLPDHGTTTLAGVAVGASWN
jgi:hypothetical protein